MDKHNGDGNGHDKSLTGYEGDTGSGSDEEDAPPSSPKKTDWPAERAVSISLPVSEETNAAALLAKPAAATMNTLVLGYHTIYDLDNTDIPLYVREHGATLTFPEKLMLKLMHVERSVAKSSKKPIDFPISWTDDGKAFVIRDRAELCRNWLPIFFQGEAKFSSFTRKLYRWGFRQIKHHSKPKAIQTGETFFGNENFQRDNTSLLACMRSVTAIKSKRQQRNLQWAEIVPAVPVAAQSPTPQLPNTVMDYTLFLQQQHSVPNLPIAPQVAPPPTAAPTANAFDMSNAFLQQNLTQASQFQLPGSFMNHGFPAQVQNQFHDSFNSNMSMDYLRQLVQLTSASNQQTMMMNQFTLQPQQTMPQMTAPFSLQPQPAFPQMVGPQQEANGAAPVQPPLQASQGSDQQQQHLLQALQLMLDQSQQQPGQQNPSSANPD